MIESKLYVNIIYYKYVFIYFRYSGASLLVVKGEKQLRTCGFLDHHKKQSQIRNPNTEVKVMQFNLYLEYICF